MALYRAQVVLQMADNNPANYVTNTWYFDADDNSVLPTIAGELEARYDAIRAELANLIRETGHEMKFYLMSDPEPRAPILEVAWDFSSGLGNTPLAPETALCMSFQGVKVSGQPQARRRGRIFFGPFSAAALGSDGRPDAGCITAITLFGDDLLDASETASDWTWVVYSPTDDAFVTIDNGWVDNEWDTQRSRGRVATSRSTFT